MAAVLLLLLVLVLVPLRLARTVRRSLQDPEFGGLFVLVIVTLAPRLTRKCGAVILNS